MPRLFRPAFSFLFFHFSSSSAVGHAIIKYLNDVNSDSLMLFMSQLYLRIAFYLVFAVEVC